MICTHVIFDDDSRHENANTLNEIAYYVYHSRLYIYILRCEIVCMAMVVMMRAVAMETVMELLGVAGRRRILRTVAMNIIVQRANGSVKNASARLLCQCQFVIVQNQIDAFAMVCIATNRIFSDATERGRMTIATQHITVQWYRPTERIGPRVVGRTMRTNAITATRSIRSCGWWLQRIGPIHQYIFGSADCHWLVDQ